MKDIHRPRPDRLRGAPRRPGGAAGLRVPALRVAQQRPGGRPGGSDGLRTARPTRLARTVRGTCLATTVLAGAGVVGLGLGSGTASAESAPSRAGGYGSKYWFRTPSGEWRYTSHYDVYLSRPPAPPLPPPLPPPPPAEASSRAGTVRSTGSRTRAASGATPLTTTSTWPGPPGVRRARRRRSAVGGRVGRLDVLVPERRRRVALHQPLRRLRQPHLRHPAAPAGSTGAAAVPAGSGVEAAVDYALAQPASRTSGAGTGRTATTAPAWCSRRTSGRA